jgi:nicotinamidase/pyrazinamidase
VQDTPGAAFHPALRLPPETVVISKGDDPDSDSYSAFDGRSEDGSSLESILAAQDMQHLSVGGLATDYCVRASVLDALKAGLAVTVLTDAIAGVEVTSGDSAKALDDMRRAGALLCSTDEMLSQIIK